MERFISFVGLFVMIGLAWLMSSNKRKFPWRVVIGGLILQFLFAGVMFASRDSAEPSPAAAAAATAAAEKAAEATPPPAGESNADEDAAKLAATPPADLDAVADAKAAAPAPVRRKGLLAAVDDAFNRLIDCVDAGSVFVFGENFKDHFFAFRVLPSIIFFAALMQALYYAGVMQRIVRGLGYLVQHTLGTTGPESLAAAANIFLGQTEAPLVVKPYVEKMTKSELMAIMVPGFGSTAGGVLIAYKLMGIDAGHLLTASLLSAPASLLVAKVMVPETEKSIAVGRVDLDMGDSGANLLEAISIGALEGLKLALNVAAMLIAFIALVAMVDGIFGWVGGWFGQQWSLSALMGAVFAPIAWMMGIAWQDATISGQLLGEKMVLNEFVAYQHLGQILGPDSAVQLSPRTVTILTYALCGFANFSSIGIQIGGIGGMAPSRQSDLAKLGLRAMLGGALANFMTACIAGMLL
jgi:CNT family concentrative nucleoside transporter